MKNKLVVVATEFEARFLFQTDSTTQTPVISGLLIKNAESTLNVLVTGIGKTNSAMVLSHYLAKYPQPSEILNIGICGAFRDHSLTKIGDIAVATEECYGDEGVVTDSQFLSMKELGFPLLKQKDMETFNIFPLTEGENTAEFLKSAIDIPVHSGRFITVSSCTGTESQKTEIKHRLNPLAESMEGAALAHVSLAHNIPFTEIRGISNFTGTYDKSSWDIKTAMINIATALKALL